MTTFACSYKQASIAPGSDNIQYWATGFNPLPEIIKILRTSSNTDFTQNNGLPYGKLQLLNHVYQNNCM